MADNVIIGTGKPRFVLPTSIIHTNTVSASNTTTVTLTTATDLTQLDEDWGLKGLQIWSTNTDDEDTWGVIQSFNDTSDVLTVESWSNGNPEVTKSLRFQGRIIDLPYCQRLTERYSPDFIEKKLLGGRIVKDKRGFYYSATLDYSGFFHKDEMEIIRHLFDSSMNGCGFYPRKDNTAVFFSVDISNDSEISFYQLQRHQGHGGIAIHIFGIERIPKIVMVDPTVAVTQAVADDSDIYVTDDTGVFPTAD
jgi:hypothetical protein